MKSWFFKLKIRQKFLLAFGSILLLSVLLMAGTLLAIQKMIDNRMVRQRSIQAENLVRQINLEIQNFSYAGYKDETFLKNGKNEAVESIRKELKDLRSDIGQLEKESSFLNIAKRETVFNNLEVLRDSLSDTFEDLISLYYRRGFKDYGLEGELRAAIHAVENSSEEYDRAMMLMLRRHEKDFFLRKDLKYREKFLTDLNQFVSSINEDSTVVNEGGIIGLLGAYRENFEKVVEIERRIGLDETSGVIGRINALAAKFDDQTSTIGQQILESSSRWDRWFLIILISLLLFQIVAGSVLAYVYSNIITRSIKELLAAMVSLSNGHFPEKLISRTSDELSELKNAVNILIDRIRTAVNFSLAIGKGELDKEYDEEFKNDVLADAIIRMQDQLREANQRQALINWENEGIARLGELIYEDDLSLNDLGDQVLQTLVNHAKMNQAALYLIDEEAKELFRLSTFAYGKKRFQEHRISIDQGLLGQAIKEKEPVFLKDVPPFYTKITSGLGEATPGYVYIVPLKSQDDVVGVMEFASFEDIDASCRKFLDRSAETIAAAIRSRNMAERTRELLQESEDRAALLTSQEEELRQNTEELIATQEEMRRQKTELEKTIEALNTELTLHKKETGPVQKD